MTRIAFSYGLAAACLALALALAPAASARTLLFEITDPAGDDHGNGRMVYPLATPFVKGDLDIVALRAYDVGNETMFEVEFAGQVRKTEAGAIDELGTDLDEIARHGFFTFNVDIYIDVDREPGSGGQAMLPGRLAEVDADHAWDRAIILTPRPGAARGELKRRWIKMLDQAMRDARTERDDDDEAMQRSELRDTVPDELSRRVYFPQKIRVRGRTVRLYVPDTFLRAKASPEWSYVVAVSGADLEASFDVAGAVGLSPQRTGLFILPVSPGTWQNRFGGGRDDAPLQPPLIDIIAPEGTTQERLLSDYDSRQNRAAQIPGVVPAEVGKAANGDER
ncbi:MAG: glucodextranase DOMON-like domain-containing protein [Acidobacteriota bacterium]